MNGCEKGFTHQRKMTAPPRTAPRGGRRSTRGYSPRPLRGEEKPPVRGGLMISDLIFHISKRARRAGGQGDERGTRWE